MLRTNSVRSQLFIHTVAANRRHAGELITDIQVHDPPRNLRSLATDHQVSGCHRALSNTVYERACLERLEQTEQADLQ